MADQQTEVKTETETDQQINDIIYNASTALGNGKLKVRKTAKSTVTINPMLMCFHESIAGKGNGHTFSKKTDEVTRPLAPTPIDISFTWGIPTDEPVEDRDTLIKQLNESYEDEKQIKRKYDNEQSEFIKAKKRTASIARKLSMM